MLKTNVVELIDVNVVINLEIFLFLYTIFNKLCVYI